MRRPTKASPDTLVRALDRLCRDVQKGMVAPPSPEILTRAILDLFPGETLVPPGSSFALNTTRVVTWCVEEGRTIMQHKNDKSLWFKRRFSRYM